MSVVGDIVRRLEESAAEFEREMTAIQERSARLAAIGEQLRLKKRRRAERRAATVHGRGWRRRQARKVVA